MYLASHKNKIKKKKEKEKEKKLAIKIITFAHLLTLITRALTFPFCVTKLPNILLRVVCRHHNFKIYVYIT